MNPTIKIIINQNIKVIKILIGEKDVNFIFGTVLLCLYSTKIGVVKGLSVSSQKWKSKK